MFARAYRHQAGENFFELATLQTEPGAKQRMVVELHFARNSQRATVLFFLAFFLVPMACNRETEKAPAMLASKAKDASGTVTTCTFDQKNACVDVRRLFEPPYAPVSNVNNFKQEAPKPNNLSMRRKG